MKNNNKLTFVGEIELGFALLGCYAPLRSAGYDREISMGKWRGTKPRGPSASGEELNGVLRCHSWREVEERCGPEKAGRLQEERTPGGYPFS